MDPLQRLADMCADAHRPRPLASDFFAEWTFGDRVATLAAHHGGERLAVELLTRVGDRLVERSNALIHPTTVDTTARAIGLCRKWVSGAGVADLAPDLAACFERTKGRR